MKSGIGKVLGGGRLFGAEMRDDPYPIYRELRESDPVHWDDSLHAWILTRYDDVGLALNDPRFSSRRVSRARQRFADPSLAPLFDTLAGRMSDHDEPDHKRLRALVHDAFLRTAVEKWTPRIQARIDLLLAAAEQRGTIDFIADFAVPLPLLVILEIVGVPATDRVRVKAWCDDFAIVALNFYANISEAELHNGLRSIVEFRQYLGERIGELESSPRTDLLSSLVQVEHEGTRLTLDELLANALLLLAAGNETTTCVLGNGLAALLNHPEQLELLRRNPSLIPAAVEEFLRYDSPVQFLGRIALEDVELRGQTIRRGDLVLAVLGAANRDPARFAEPDRLDVTRAHVPHFAFGHGPHFCAGAQLARLEAQMAFAGLLARFRAIELDTTSPLVRRENFNIRCWEQLPVRLNV
ncbi:MAG TPA: cytochrome P450 [Pirellulaceae bacterium]|nr:cytochrome P450 [Pirellulaceae bacterium]